MHKIPKSAHLSHRLPPLKANVSISLANFSHCWQACRVSCSRYRTRCFLVRGGRLIRFISSSEEGVVRGRKVLVQFLRHCFLTVATRSALKRWASFLWHSSSLLCASASFFFHASSSNHFCSTIFASFQAWRSRRSFSSCCQSRVSALAHLLANSAS